MYVRLHIVFSYLTIMNNHVRWVINIDYTYAKHLIKREVFSKIVNGLRGVKSDTGYLLSARFLHI